MRNLERKEDWGMGIESTNRNKMPLWDGLMPAMVSLAFISVRTKLQIVPDENTYLKYLPTPSSSWQLRGNISGRI